jgi:hypothetical protein
MRTPAEAYTIISNPDGRNVEYDSHLCAHCQKVGFVTAGFSGQMLAIIRGDGSVVMREPHVCRKCMRKTCLKRQCVQNCTPFLKKLDQYEKQQRKLILEASWI